MPYIGEERDRSPLNVMLDERCHCLDGGFLAALALWQIGFKPLLIDLVPEHGKDDDHVLALYQLNGRWGAVAKSNYVNLGFREPVYKNLRELVMTYFEHYVSVDQKKTLRGYTRPLDASRYVHLHWARDEEVVLHPNCSARKLGLDSKLLAIAQKCTRSATVPLNLGCCAFAGDRGLLFPELTASATEKEAAEVNTREYDGYYSTNIPCEIGMTEATGRDYTSIVYLVEKASRTV